MKITERTRIRAVTVESHRTREERDLLTRALRRSKSRNGDMFDQGFDAAVKLMENGATLEQIKAKQRPSKLGCDDTQPMVMPDFDREIDTEVDGVAS